VDYNGSSTAASDQSSRTRRLVKDLPRRSRQQCIGQILPYDWHAVFSTSLSFNSKTTGGDVSLDFPVRISATTVAVKQASGGIVTPPTGGHGEI
jgi:hypothetical protein